MTEADKMPITVDEAWLAMQSAGTLSPYKQLLLACQAELRPEVRQAFAISDQVGGAILESAKGTDLSDTFMQRLSERIAPASAQTTTESHRPGMQSANDPEWVPGALSDFLRRSGQRLKWRSVGAGVQQSRIASSPSGERLYLLKARPGFAVPKHSHRGQEWTLVLTGGYKSGAQQFVAGDLHQEDETCLHDLRIDDDGPCISLIADDGKLTFANPLLKLLQPLFGL